VLKGISTHEEAEAILLELGNTLGFKTYTPDLSKQYKGRKLGDISTLKEVPSGFFASDIFCLEVSKNFLSLSVIDIFFLVSLEGLLL